MFISKVLLVFVHPVARLRSQPCDCVITVPAEAWLVDISARDARSMQAPLRSSDLWISWLPLFTGAEEDAHQLDLIRNAVNTGLL